MANAPAGTNPPPTSTTQPAPARQEPLLGLGATMAAFGLLLFAHLSFGIAMQTRDVISGLWINEAIAIALPAFILLRLANVRTASYLGLGRTTWKALLVAVAAGVLNQPVVSLLEQAAHSFLPAKLVEDFDSKQQLIDTIFGQHRWGMVLTVTIAAPLGEEIFFRGLAQNALSRSMKPLFAALLSGALFSSIHLDPVGFVGLWEIGFLLAVLRWWSGSLWPAVVGHAVNNGVAATAFALGWQDPSVSPPQWLLALGMIFLIVGGALSLRVLNGPPGALLAEERARSDVSNPDGYSFSRAWPLLLIWTASVGYGFWQLLGMYGKR